MKAHNLSKIAFRQPLDSECDLLWQIALCSKQHWGYDDSFIEACREELKVSPQKMHSPEFHYQLGEVAGKVFGFYCLESLTDCEMEVEALFISPDFIGKGLGAKLWMHLLENAKSKGTQKLCIASEPFAEAFYLKMGAIRVGEIASGSIPGRTLPLMEYRLDDV